MSAMTSMQASENHLWESILFVHHVGIGDWTQVVSLAQVPLTFWAISVTLIKIFPNILKASGIGWELLC